MKITFGMIVLNGGFFLRQILETIYPFAHRICIAEGPVKWFYEEGGIYRSTDDTIDIIKNFPDPERKIDLFIGSYYEKDHQCRAWFSHVPSDTDYVFCVDADEVHRPENIEALIRYLESEKPTSVGFKSDSFYGGFQYIIGGFERDHSFKRVLQYKPGCRYRTHRQPSLSMSTTTSDVDDIKGKDIKGNQLYEATGITMPHFSYTSPLGVKRKLDYYQAAVIAPGKCIPDYFKSVYLPWVQLPEHRKEIENLWKGVQEFVPDIRDECYTELFTGQLPDIIIRDMPQLTSRFNIELAQCLKEVEWISSPQHLR